MLYWHFISSKHGDAAGNFSFWHLADESCQQEAEMSLLYTFCAVIESNTQLFSCRYLLHLFINTWTAVLMLLLEREAGYWRNALIGITCSEEPSSRCHQQFSSLLGHKQEIKCSFQLFGASNQLFWVHFCCLFTWKTVSAPERFRVFEISVLHQTASSISIITQTVKSFINYHYHTYVFALCSMWHIIEHEQPFPRNACWERLRMERWMFRKVSQLPATYTASYHEFRHQNKARTLITIACNRNVL